MTMTDPIADMLTRIRNGNVAMQEKVKMPSSKLKESLANILKREGYIEDFQVREETGRPGRVLEISMKYSAERQRTISGLRRGSEPGPRGDTPPHPPPRAPGGLGGARPSAPPGPMARPEG